MTDRVTAPRVVDVDTPVGPARLHVDRPVGSAHVLLALGHGAGGGVSAPDLVALSRSLPAAGVAVVRVEQPWRVAGSRVAPRPTVLDRAWVAAVTPARQLVDPALPLVVGGRSAGARVACRTASTLDAIGVLALAFPLRPPGRPGLSRADELTAVQVPVLVVQGERDVFGAPAAVPAGPAHPHVRVLPVPDADHGFAVRRGTSRAAVLAFVSGRVGAWLATLTAVAAGNEA